MSRALTTASLVAVSAGALWLYVGEEPGCYEVVAVGPCESAKQLAQESIECRDGTEVAVPIELRVTSREDDIELPQRWRLHGDSPRKLDCRDLLRPDAVTVRPVAQARGMTCIAGLVSKDVSEAADGSRRRTWPEPHQCCGSRCRCDDSNGCATVLHAEPLQTWRARWCEGDERRCEEAGNVERR